jgi:hypothetical protein
VEKGGGGGAKVRFWVIELVGYIDRRPLQLFQRASQRSFARRHHARGVQIIGIYLCLPWALDTCGWP